MDNTYSRTLCLLSTLVCAQGTHAIEIGNIEMTGSGFLTLTAGKVLSGLNNDSANAFGFDGPSLTVDYANNGTYEKGDGLTLAPNSTEPGRKNAGRHVGRNLQSWRRYVFYPPVAANPARRRIQKRAGRTQREQRQLNRGGTPITERPPHRSRRALRAPVESLRLPASAACGKPT